MTHAVTWTDRGDTMLSEMNRTQKDRYCMILLLCGTQRSQVHWKRARWWLPGVGVSSECSMSAVSFWKDGKVLELDGGDA